MKRLRWLWGRIRSRKGLGRDVTIVAVMLLMGTGALAWILAGQRFPWPWEKRVVYHADFVEAPSINPGKGQEVRIAGVVVGDITKATVTKEGRARVTLSVKPKYAEVYDNARVYLRPRSPLNDMYVLIDPGGKPGRRLRSGSVIPVAQTVRPIQVDEALSHLDGTARKALEIVVTELDTALARPQSVPAALRAGSHTLASLRPVMEALETRRERVARLVSALADIATAVGSDDARLTRLLADVRSAVGALAARDPELDATLARLPDVTAELGRASGRIQAVAGELDPALDGLRGAADRLPSALAGLRRVVERLDGTLDRAGPVVSAARPVIADLRPLLTSAQRSLSDIAAISPRLDPITANLVRYLPSVQQAVYQANSVVSLEDANGPVIRAWPTFGHDSLPPSPGMPERASLADARAKQVSP